MGEIPGQIERQTDQSTGLSFLKAKPPGTKVDSAANSADSLLTIVLVHGYACRAVDFLPLLKYLLFKGNVIEGRSIQYIAIDLPGHGKSPASTCPVPNIPNFSHLVVCTLRQLNIRDFVIFGHSMGCRVALTVSAYALGYSSQYPNVASEASSKTTVSSPCSNLNPKAAILLDGAVAPLQHQPKQPPHTVNLAIETKSANPLEHFFSLMLTPAVPLPFREELLQHVLSRDEDYIRRLKDCTIDLDDEINFLATAERKRSTAASQPPSQFQSQAAAAAAASSSSSPPSSSLSPDVLPILTLQSTLPFLPVSSHLSSNPQWRLSFTSDSPSVAASSPTIQYLLRRLPRNNVTYKILCFRSHFPHAEGKAVQSHIEGVGIGGASRDGPNDNKTGVEEVGEAVWEFLNRHDVTGH